MQRPKHTGPAMWICVLMLLTTTWHSLGHLHVLLPSSNSAACHLSCQQENLQATWISSACAITNYFQTFVMSHKTSVYMLQLHQLFKNSCSTVLLRNQSDGIATCHTYCVPEQASNTSCNTCVHNKSEDVTSLLSNVHVFKIIRMNGLHARFNVQNRSTMPWHNKTNPYSPMFVCFGYSSPCLPGHVVT